MGEQIDFIADTSAIIGVLRRDAVVEEKISGKNFAITFVTLAELSLGVLKAARPDAAWSRIQDVIGNCQMFHVSTVTPAIYARIYFDLVVLQAKQDICVRSKQDTMREQDNGGEREGVFLWWAGARGESDRHWDGGSG